MWFVEELKLAGIEFDHLYAFERDYYKSEYFAGMPEAYKNKTTYFRGAIKGAHGPEKINPLKRIPKYCTAKDYCILKVDFDYDPGEQEIMRTLDGSVAHSSSHGHNLSLLQRSLESAEVQMQQQIVHGILHDESVRALIDELFFEPWGDRKESYQMLKHLRELGVRAHSWV